MSSVGAHLRQLREARGVSLEEIARVTRVNPSYLHALEADDFTALPPPVFTRGFIRAYCQALGDPPDQALALFEGRGASSAAAPPGAPSTGAPLPGASSPAASPAAVPSARAAGSASPSRATSEPPPRNRGPVLVSFVLLVVLGVALFAVTLALQSGREAPESPRAARPAAVPDAAVAPPRPTGTAAPPAVTPPAVTPAPTSPPAAEPAGYRLVARTVEPTWIRVRTDDGRTTEETIPAGQMREWVSSGPFTLTVGNAGGISLELNGRALPPLGAKGVVIPRLVIPTESP
jgi:cytoskeleton protein RodZ